MYQTEETNTTEPKEIPAEFGKIINDFVNDLLNTFPEYTPLISKWWNVSKFEEVKEDEERAKRVEQAQGEKMRFIFDYCLRVFPERFFDILYQNVDIFSETSLVNTEFLPGISFKYIWNSEISDTTRETIWKYLQLIMFTVVSSVKNKDAFGDTSKLFESINQDEFKNKLEETLEKMQHAFDNINLNETQSSDSTSETVPNVNMPSAENIHQHLSGMLDGKLGQLAKEIAEETANGMNLDMENMTDMKDVLQNLIKNPNKLMGLVKNVGEKLDSRIKSGDIKESELFSEASEIMNQMKNMPGMDNIQEMLSKLGMGGSIPGLGKNAKVNVNAMQAQLDRNLKQATVKEQMKKRLEMKKIAQQKEAERERLDIAERLKAPQMSDEEITKYFSTGEKVEKTPRIQTNGGKKKKGKK
jgi:hypothetical protein